MENLFKFLNEETRKLDELIADLRKRMRINELLQTLRNDLMNCKSNADLNELIFKHLDMLSDNPKLFKHVNSAKKRINAVNSVKKTNWKNQLN